MILFSGVVTLSFTGNSGTGSSAPVTVALDEKKSLKILHFSCELVTIVSPSFRCGTEDTFWDFINLVRIENFFFADISEFFIVVFTALKKFSFTKLISDMVSGFFGFVQTAIDWIKSVIADPKAALAALWLKIVGEGGLIDILWAPIKGAYEWVKTLFTDPVTALKALWTGLFGEGGLLDLFWTPINSAIDWVTKKFGWRDDAAPKFNLLKIITDVVEEAWRWIKNTFSWDKVKGALTSWIPGMGSEKEKAPPLTGKEKEEFDAQALEASQKDKVARARLANFNIVRRNRGVLGQQGKINIENARERLAAAQKEQGIDKAKGMFYGRSDDDKTAEQRAKEQVAIEKAQAHLKSLENKQSAVQEAMKINNSIIQKGGDSTTVVVQKIESPNANAQKRSR